MGLPASRAPAAPPAPPASHPGEDRLPRPAPAPRTARPGLTLLELLVVLVLIGLAAALAAPALRPPAEAPAWPLARTVAAARATALRRAESLRLEVEADGRWRLLARDSVLARGALDARGAAATLPLRLGISPLGVCVPESPDDARAAPATWDAGSCAPAGAAREGGA